MVVGFWSSFVVTLVLVGATVWTGFTARRRAHLGLALAAVAMLTVTILLTERLVRAIDFPEAEMAIHLIFAKTGALLVLPVAVTGILTWRRPTWKKVHLTCVALFLLDVLIATGTGIWVFSLSTPRGA